MTLETVMAVVFAFAIGAVMAHLRARAMAVVRLAKVERTALEREALLREQLAGAEAVTIEHSAEGRWLEHGESVQTTLTQLTDHLGRIEAQRVRDTTTMSEAVRTLHEASVATRDEARNLAHALNDNRSRGVWGEMQLRRVLEQSGMDRHADFVEQRGVSSNESQGRPDAVVRLPNDRRIVIDAKAPLDRFLVASQCDDPVARSAALVEHGKALYSHVMALSKRSYSEHVDGAVDFVVLFVPGDAFLSAALEGRPALLEEAFALNVVLASPSTLLALLRAVACGWRERRIAEDGHLIAQAGRELYERLGVFVDHYNRVGNALGSAVDAYNKATGSFDRRVLPSARRLHEHGAGTAKLMTVSAPLDSLPVPSGLGACVAESGSDAA